MSYEEEGREATSKTREPKREKKERKKGRRKENQQLMRATAECSSVNQGVQCAEMRGMEITR